MLSLVKVLVVSFFSFLLIQPIFAESEQLTQTTLPLKFIVGNPPPFLEPTIAIIVQGKSIPLIFDTGAKKLGLILSEDALKKISAKFTGKQICFNMIDGKHCEQEFIVPEIQIGAFLIKNSHGVQMPKSWNGVIGSDRNKATEASLNGIIGFPILSQFNVLLDPVNSKVMLIKAGNKPVQYDIQKWVSIPFEGHLSTKLKIDDRLVTLAWDTAAMPSGISRSIAKYFDQKKCPLNYPNAKDKNCYRVESKSLTTLNNEKLPNNWFNVQEIPANAPLDGLVGSNFFADNLVYFDFDNHIIYVKPNHNN